MPRALSLLLLCAAAHAAEVDIPTAPPPVFADTESVTNAALPAAVMARARLLHCTVELGASASNCVEVAFGCDADGDGSLAEGEAAMRLGWDSGAWFLASPTNRVRSAAFAEAASRSLTFQLRVRENGSPVSLAVSDANAGGLFPDLANAPPAWLFSQDWDTVRLTVRGTDERDESLSVRLDTDAGILILR